MNVHAWEAVKGRVMGLELICPGLVLVLFSNMSSHLLCPSLECLMRPLTQQTAAFFTRSWMEVPNFISQPAWYQTAPPEPLTLKPLSMGSTIPAGTLPDVALSSLSCGPSGHSQGWHGQGAWPCGQVEQSNNM